MNTKDLVDLLSVAEVGRHDQIVNECIWQLQLLPHTFIDIKREQRNSENVGNCVYCLCLNINGLYKKLLSL